MLDGAFGELLATSLAARGVRGLIIGAGLRDTRELREMGFPAWTAHVSAQGTVKETPGAVNVPVTLGGQVIRPGRRDRRRRRRRVRRAAAGRAAAVTASAARIAKEDASRKELADGVLGLDLYDLRPKLAGVEYISFAEYVRRAGEGGAHDGIRAMQMRGGTSKGRTSSPPTCPPTPPSATTCCCGSWGRPTRGRSTGSAARTR